MFFDDSPGRAPTAGAPDRPGRRPAAGAPFGSVEILATLLVALVALRPWLAGVLDSARLQTWTTIFVAIMVQALPFLVFGVVASALISIFVPAEFWARALPSRPALAVPVAGAAGVALPGCECGAVPIAGSLMRRGVTPAAALAFLLSAPAVNPVVLTATAIAFPGQPRMVVARAAASLVVAVLMGWLWLRLGRPEWLRLSQRSQPAGGSRGRAFWGALRHDVMHAGGFLVLGALAAATIREVLPERWLTTVAGQPVAAVAALAALAVLLSICSEADAFVAASLTQFPLSARLVFLVVGPAVDLKLVAMQAGVFGRGFALRFAPATLGTAVGVAALLGWVLL